MAVSMCIYVVAGPGTHIAPVITAHRRWLGPCKQCGEAIQPGEIVTYVPDEPITVVRTTRMVVIHVACVQIPIKYHGRSCSTAEFEYVKALAR